MCVDAPTGFEGLLGVDTATADTAVAVTFAGELVSERSVPPGTDGRPRHAPALLGEIAAVVDQAGGWERIGAIAVGVGPGTFTGLRVGIATVRAIAQARELAVVGVSSLAALALGIDAPPGASKRSRLAVIDARRGQVFAAAHRVDAGVIWEPFVAVPEELCARVGELELSPVAVGDGSLRFRMQLEAAGVDVLPDADPAHRMAARHICALAVESEAGRPERVAPLYLRRPDAEIWHEQQHRDSETARPS